MDDMNLPYIGEIDVLSLNLSYRTTIFIGGMDVNLDVNLEKDSLYKKSVLRLKFFLENLSKFHVQNLLYIKNNFYLKNSVVKEYIKFQIDDYGDSIYETLELDEGSIKSEEMFLTKFSLTRIGIYMENNGTFKKFAVFDYSICEVTNYLIVLKTDDRGNVNDICWES